jgi:hypothetical protein
MPKLLWALLLLLTPLPKCGGSSLILPSYHASYILDYVKLTKIVMIQMLGLVKDEWVFSNLNCINTKIQNWLNDNLALCVCMFKQFFFYKTQFSL